jgi:hypothetical protein
MKMAFAVQLFLKNSFTEFYKNFTDGLVADARSRMVGHCFHIGFTPHKERLNWSVKLLEL